VSTNGSYTKMRRRNLGNYGQIVFLLRCRHAFQICITKNIASDLAAPTGVICLLILCSWITVWSVGWVFWPVKTVSHITYTVLEGM